MISLEGSNFIPWIPSIAELNVRCAFTWSPQPVNASYPPVFSEIAAISTTQINCTAPAYPPTSSANGGPSNFGVTLVSNNTTISQQHLPFFYYTVPSVYSSNPNNARQQGISSTTIYGANFAPLGSALKCTIGNQTMQATYYNTSAISCPVPAAPPGKPVAILVSNALLTSPMNATFEYWGV